MAKPKGINQKAKWRAHSIRLARYADRVQSVYDTFFAEDDVFVAAATYPAGAEGTFADPYGGSYAMLTLQWLEWTLKDKAWCRTVFTGEECICYFKGWGVQQRNENTVIE